MKNSEESYCIAHSISKFKSTVAFIFPLSLIPLVIYSYLNNIHSSREIYINIYNHDIGVKSFISCIVVFYLWIPLFPMYFQSLFGKMCYINFYNSKIYVNGKYLMDSNELYRYEIIKSMKWLRLKIKLYLYKAEGQPFECYFSFKEKRNEVLDNLKKAIELNRGSDPNGNSPLN